MIITIILSVMMLLNMSIMTDIVYDSELKEDEQNLLNAEANAQN